MATVTAPPSFNESQRAEYHRRVTDPLERLRGYIRSYVTAEGAAVLGVYLALWFWIGLALDFGIFKVFGWDWVQILPWGFRAVVLAILSAGLLTVVTMKVGFRLMREFRDPAVALVLERRFPQVLGDRLITAVELADPRIASRYGFSQAMIDQTIREAADRVKEVPVAEAFNWTRLKKYGFTVLLLTVGMYVLTGIGYCLVNRQPDVGGYFTHFNNTAITWFERNILLANSIWPRKAFLEVVPGSYREKVGRNVASSPVRVRAVKWIYADSDAAEGWRAMKWSDLTPGLAGDIPKVPGDWAGWTIDRVEIQVSQAEFRQALANRNAVADLDQYFEKLRLAADSPANARSFRKLEIPEVVTVYYHGGSQRSEMTLSAEGINEFSGLFSELSDDIQFTACAVDYCTPYQTIDVVDPPSLEKLTRQEWQPAYLYHRPPRGGQLSDLKGRKQAFPAETVYTGGDTSRLDVPAGTDIELTGYVGEEDDDMPLTEVKLTPRKGRSGDGAARQLPKAVLKENGRQFSVRFNNVVDRIDFDFEITDTNKVSSRRHIVIQAMDDVAPEVNAVIEVLRKTARGYLCTPKAMVPFSGNVRDDRGLTEINYAYTIQQETPTGAVRARTMFAGLAYHLTPQTPVIGIGPYLQAMAHYTRPIGAQDQSTHHEALPTFQARLRQQSVGDVSSEQFEKLLQGRPPQGRLFREHNLVSDELTRLENQDYFDLEKYLPQILAVGENEVQRRYRLRLWIVAKDNNIENGPLEGESKERFNILVVPEVELLSEIAKEEENLNLKARQLLTRLKDARVKLDQVVRELEDPKFEKKFFSPLATRALEIAEVIGSSAVTAQEMHRHYSRILRELRYNRVRQGMIDKVETIVKLLETAVQRQFIEAEDAQRRFQKALEGNAEKMVEPKYDPALGKDAKLRLDQLIEQMEKVKGAIGDLIGINDLIVTLRGIEEEQRNTIDMLNELRIRIEAKIFEDLLNPKKKP